MQTVTQAVRQSPEPANPYAKRYIIAWALALVFYFLEYAARSSPAVMIRELTAAFGVTVIGVSAIIGTYYYTYSVTNLIAGVALDRAGGKWVIPIGAFVLAAGCFAFAVSSSLTANVGRLLQGAGSSFALPERSIWRHMAESLGEDEDAEGRSESAQMFAEGISEAEHDQMLRAAEADEQNDEE
jgi:sugar phosphate permease